MGNILSKEEIEALLKGEAKEEKLKGKVVRSYDFRAAERLSKEHLGLFQILTEDFCHRLRNRLSSQLRLEEVEVEILSIKQTTFKDFLSLASPTYIAIFSMEPLEGNAAMEIDVGFLSFFIEGILGGKAKEKPKVKELTQLEREISSALAKRILVCFEEAFEKAIKFKTRIESVETNPHFVTIASPHETVMFITLEMKLKGISGEINICLPYLILEPFIPHLSKKRWFMYAQKKASLESEERLKKHLSNTVLTLVVQLGSCKIPLQELYNLQRGDYIRLDKPKDSLLELQIGGLTKFKVQPGLVGRRIAVKIVSLVEESL